MRMRLSVAVLVSLAAGTPACKPRLDADSSVKESNVQKLNELDQVQVVYRKGESVFLVTCKPSEIAAQTKQNVEDVIFVTAEQCSADNHTYQELPIAVYRERLQYLANYQKADYEKALTDIKGYKRQLVIAQTNLRRAQKDLAEINGTAEGENNRNGENGNREKKEIGAAGAQEARELRNAISRLTSDKESAEQQVASLQDTITTNEQRSASVEKIVKLLDPMDSKMNSDDQTTYGIDHTFLVSSRTGDWLVAPFSGDRADWSAPDMVDPVRRNAYISSMNGKSWVFGSNSRDAVTFGNARQACAKAGGRLPTPNEIAQLSAFGPVNGEVDAINKAIAGQYLWSAPLGIAAPDSPYEVGVFEARDANVIGYYSTAMSLSQEPDWHGATLAITANAMMVNSGSANVRGVAITIDPRTLSNEKNGAKALCLVGDAKAARIFQNATGRYFLCETKFPANKMDEMKDYGSQIIAERVAKCVAGGESSARAVANLQACIDRVKARWKKGGYATPDPLTAPAQACVEVGAN